MLQYPVPTVSITGPSGRIWSVKPNPGVSGLVTVLHAPASKVSEAVRAPDYTAIQLDARADRLLTADSRGSAYLFNIRQNRFVRLDRTGHAGTAVAFCPHSPRLAFVAYADATIRCYDTSRNAAVGLLREHRRCVAAVAFAACKLEADRLHRATGATTLHARRTIRCFWKQGPSNPRACTLALCVGAIATRAFLPTHVLLAAR